MGGVSQTWLADQQLKIEDFSNLWWDLFTTLQMANRNGSIETTTHHAGNLIGMSFPQVDLIICIG